MGASTQRPARLHGPPLLQGVGWLGTPGQQCALARGKEGSPSRLPLTGDPTYALSLASRLVLGAGASSPAHTCPLVTVLPAWLTPPHIDVGD